MNLNKEHFLNTKPELYIIRIILIKYFVCILYNHKNDKNKADKIHNTFVVYSTFPLL